MFLIHSDYIGVPLFRIVLAGLLTVLLIGLEGCGRSTPVRQTMDRAESIMESAPDSAYGMLRGIDSAHLVTDGDRGRYALLMTMAMDKNSIEVTDIEVIQPAVEYYMHHGTADDKLRMHYYLGRIHQNRREKALSMRSFLDGLSVGGEISDSLTYARLLVAQGHLYEMQYKLDEQIQRSIIAAGIFYRHGRPQSALNCYARALDNAVILDRHSLSDSLMECCRELFDECPGGRSRMCKQELSYLMLYGTAAQLDSMLRHMGYVSENSLMNLDMARAAVRLDSTEKALRLVGLPIELATIDDTLKYMGVKAEVLEHACDYRAGMVAYKEYLYALSREHARMFRDRVLFASDFYDLETAVILETKERRILFWMWLATALAAVLVLSCVLLLYRHIRDKHRATVKENSKLRYDSNRLQSENRRIEEEKQKVENVLEMQVTSTALLREEVQYLKNEKEELMRSLAESKDMADNVRCRLKERVDILNGLLAKEISENTAYAAPYLHLVEKFKKDKEAFVDSISTSLRYSYPAFVSWLEASGLSESEIDLVCLYAIGMRGKEIVKHVGLKSQYNHSSIIRSKLGLGIHDTNLGIYIRKKMAELG